jgi:type II secretory pathway component GspD/PulD (secretin)
MANPGMQRVQIVAMCVQVPEGFAADSGLMVDSTSQTGGKSSLVVASLNQREAKMLHTLIRINPERSVLSRPHILVPDGRTGVIHIGGQVPVAMLVEATPPGGEPGDMAVIKMVEYGINLQVTPRISKDGRYFSLDADLGISELFTEVPTTPLGFRDSSAKTKTDFVRAGASTKGMGITESSIKSSMVLPVGGTMVFGGQVQLGSAPKKSELLWILTPSLR